MARTTTGAGKLTASDGDGSARISAPFTPGAGVEPGPWQAGMDSRENIMTGSHPGTAIKYGFARWYAGIDIQICLLQAFWGMKHPPLIKIIFPEVIDSARDVPGHRVDGFLLTPVAGRFPGINQQGAR